MEHTIRISVMFKATRLKLAKILLYWVVERAEKAAFASRVTSCVGVRVGTAVRSIGREVEAFLTEDMNFEMRVCKLRMSFRAYEQVVRGERTMNEKVFTSGDQIASLRRR